MVTVVSRSDRLERSHIKARPLAGFIVFACRTCLVFLPFPEMDRRGQVVRHGVFGSIHTIRSDQSVRVAAAVRAPQWDGGPGPAVQPAAFVRRGRPPAPEPGGGAMAGARTNLAGGDFGRRL